MIRLDRHVLAQIVMQQMTPTEAVVRASVAIEGDASTLPELFDLLDEFRLMFPVRAALAGIASDLARPPPSGRENPSRHGLSQRPPLKLPTKALAKAAAKAARARAGAQA
jgi:hypothetical protein